MIAWVLKEDSTFVIAILAVAGILMAISMFYMLVPPPAAILTGNTIIYSGANTLSYTISTNQTISGGGLIYPGGGSNEMWPFLAVAGTFELLDLVVILRMVSKAFFPKRKGMSDDMPTM